MERRSTCTRREFLSLTAKFAASGTALVTLPHLISCSKWGIYERPNIVFVLADDLGWGQLGCYGSSFYETPNIDRLASEGMRFTNAYAAAPVCSPTRASIMTGKYPARLHLTDFIPGNDPPHNSMLIHPEWLRYLPLEELTLAEALKKEGYATASFGKWHLSQAKTPPQSLPFNPDKHGFEDSFVTYKPVPSLAKEWQTAENDAHNVEIITRKALNFIEGNRGRPFFLYVTHNTIHTPLMEKMDLIAKYEAKPGSDLPKNNPIIAAMLETLDKSIGRLLRRLDVLRLTENTVIVFFSDNGGLEQVADQTPLRGGKASLYEGGIRVPLIIRWPGKVNAGIVEDDIVCCTDFFPTFLEVAGSTANYDNIDGVSLMPLLTESDKIQREAIFWHYPHYHSSGVAPSGAVRQGEYKLIEWYEQSLLGLDNQIELFNLREDIEESDNLAQRMPEKAEELRNLLKNWHESVGAQMPAVNRDYYQSKANVAI